MTGHGFIFYSEFAKFRCMHKNYQYIFFCLESPPAVLTTQYEVWNERWKSFGEEERWNSVVFLCVCISALVLLCSASEPFVFTSIKKFNVQYSRMFGWLQNGQVIEWLTDWVTDDLVGGSFSVYRAWHRTDMGRWSKNVRMKNRQREIETVIKRQQVSKRSVTRLCWSAVSGCSR